MKIELEKLLGNLGDSNDASELTHYEFIHAKATIAIVEQLEKMNGLLVDLERTIRSTGWTP